jgi:hypothetical protein
MSLLNKVDFPAFGGLYANVRKKEIKLQKVTVTSTRKVQKNELVCYPKIATTRLLPSSLERLRVTVLKQ